jgi:enoyl-CoA hydratase/carnithine racemase
MTDTAGAGSEGRIVTELRGHVLVIRIDRPAKLNGFTVKMIRELSAAYTQPEESEEARVGLLCAEGRHFTAGLQLDQLGPFMARGETVWPAGEVDPLGLRERRRTKPVGVAAVFREVQARFANSADAKEGVASFVAKRATQFTGR